jgi:predicted methyltransferase
MIVEYSESRNAPDRNRGIRSLKPSLIATIATATRLQEGEEGIKRILREISLHERLSTRDLARAVNIPVPVIGAVRRELEKAGILLRQAGIVLSPTGQSLVGEEISPIPASPSCLAPAHIRCPTCQGRKISPPREAFADLENRVAHYLARRPPNDPRLDQSKCLVTTVMQRIFLLQSLVGLEGKKVIMIGDDDFQSIALGLTLKYATIGTEEAAPLAKIMVIDCDARILATIDEIASVEHLPISTQHWDARQPLPPELRNQYDIFLTDPPYTLAGCQAFLERGIEALISQSGKSGLLSYAHRSPDETLRLEQMITGLGLAIMEIFPGFNEYEGAEMFGGSGQALLLATTSRTGRAPIPAPGANPFYTRENRRESPKNRHFRR